MAAYALATEGVRASAVTMLTLFAGNNLDPVSLGLKHGLGGKQPGDSL